MESILQKLENLAELSDEDLSALKGEIVSTFKELNKDETVTAESVEQLNSLADASDAVRQELSRRETEVAELSAAREAAVSRLTEAEAAAEEPEVEDEPDQAADDDEDEKVFAAKEPEASVVESTETVTELAAEAVEPTAPVEAELAVEAAAAPEPTPTSAEAPEAELAVEEVVVEPAPVEAELAVEAPEAVETPAVEAELSVEEDAASAADAPAEAELAVEDTAAVETEAVTASAEDESREDAEETVTAAANSQELEVPAGREPVLEATKAASVPVTITAAANIPGVRPDSELKDLSEVANAFVKRLQTMGSSVRSADGERLSVATFAAAYPEDRYLGDNKDSNSEKIASITAPSAITAAGGSCAPVEVRYDVFSFNEETGRPVRDALASFAADRGGVRFVTPPVLADLEGAVSTWTLADDESAVDGTPTKPSLRVECGDEVVVYTDAIPLILTFGNMGARAYPELVARHVELGQVWHARYAETKLLTRIGALSTAVTGGTLGAELGITRDFFVNLEQLAAGYRNRYRLDSASPLRVLLPEWLRNAMRADLVKQSPGDGMDLTFNLSDATINGFFAARNINVSWFIDGEAGQIMGAQAAGAPVTFPANLVWYLFSEGTFLFLDGGTLDLGVVRDSQLNSTNDYQMFLETFEGVAKIGIESLRVTSPVAIYGAAAALVDTTA